MWKSRDIYATEKMKDFRLFKVVTNVVHYL